jgi:regulatory protein
MLVKPKSQDKKSPRKITEISLQNIALHYLQRYASSKENLKSVLKRRVLRSAKYHEIDIKETSVWIETLVNQLTKSGVVDDQTYAEGRMRALFRNGVSPKRISQKLMQKGINSDLIKQVTAKLYIESTDPNLIAAKNLVKRRRLGPYRQPNKREERQDKDLAAVARAGFDFQTAHKVIYAETIKKLEEEF